MAVGKWVKLHVNTGAAHGARRLALTSINYKQELSSMSDLPKCPACGSEYTYEDGNMYVCPECAHEWSKDVAAETADAGLVVVDANGNTLQDGDTVSVIKDLKVKGSSSVVKVGTKVKNIRLVEGDHNIDCKIDGIGAMKLKSEFVKKV
jgi:protein PhnA